jgi:hypothetical protein
MDILDRESVAAEMLAEYRNQLDVIRAARENLNGFLGDHYRWMMTEDDHQIAWKMAKAIMVPDFYDYVQDEAREMTQGEAEQILLGAIRRLQDEIDADPFTFGVVQNQERYIEQGMLSVLEAHHVLTSIYYGTRY